MDISSSMFLDAAAPFRAGDNAALHSALPGGATAADAGEQFEGIFVSMLLKEMRQSMSDDGLFAGDTSDVYGGLFDMFLGQHIASQGAFGISELINRQLQPPSDAQNSAIGTDATGTTPAG